MKYRSFGNTSSLTVSAIGLGLAALGRPGYINLGHAEDLGQDYGVARMQAQTHRMLDLAWDAGIRYFDAAQSYGKAEEFLGSWLKKRYFEQEFLLGSKWGYTYTADWQIEAEKHEVKTHDLATLTRQWESSSERLMPYLGLYQIHSATFESGVLENTKVLNALAELKLEGVLIGLSLSGPDQGAVLAKAMEVEIDGFALFDAVQATWNVLEPSAGPQLEEAHARGMAVIVKEALANGRLTSRNQAPDFQSSFAHLAEMSAQVESSIDALAIAAALAQPWVSVVLSGAAKAEHLYSNLAALDIPESALDRERLARLAEAPKAYWETRKGLAWN